MTHLTRLTALAVCLLLLAAPTSFACGELGTMAPHCPMADMEGMSAMTGSTGMPSCHGPGQMSSDCCDVRSAPEPMQAQPLESAKLVPALEPTDLAAVASPAVAIPPPRAMPADAWSLHDLGRYTLFSALLL